MDLVAGEVCVDLPEAATPSTGRSKLGKLWRRPVASSLVMIHMIQIQIKIKRIQMMMMMIQRKLDTEDADDNDDTDDNDDDIMMIFAKQH